MSLDLAALTHRRQAASDAAAPPGLPGPVWRLFDYGPISRVIPSSGARPPFYVAVWAADGADGLLVLRATALGADGLTASVEASLMRQPDGVSVGRMAIRGSPVNPPGWDVLNYGYRRRKVHEGLSRSARRRLLTLAVPVCAQIARRPRETGSRSAARPRLPPARRTRTRI